MARLNKPLQGVLNLLTLISSFIFTGIRKKFSRKDFIPVTWVALKDLKVDAKYQRLINITFVEKAEKFEPKLVKPLSVFRRPNGDLFIVDGQHTAVLAGKYVDDHENFELPCQIQDHDLDLTIEQCQLAEAEYFSRFNYLRNNMGAIEKFRVDISQGLTWATNLLDKLESLQVHIQGIGASDELEVHGFKQLRTSLGKYTVSYTKRAVDLCKFHIDKKHWSKPLDGSMILAVAAAYHFAENYLGDGGKREGFLKYLSSTLSKKTPKVWKYKTAGQLQDVLMLERMIEHYNSSFDYGNTEGCPIGSSGKTSLFKDWKDDEIHKKKTDNDEDS